jgi:TonB family protein
MKHFLLLSTACLFGVFSTTSWGQADNDYPETAAPGLPGQHDQEELDHPPAWEKCAALASVAEQQQCTQSKIVRHLSTVLEYPASAQQEGVSGTVLVRFVVGLQGEVEDVEIARGVSESLDRAAVKAIESLPKFVPGKDDGKSVRTELVVPVRFAIN